MTTFTVSPVKKNQKLLPEDQKTFQEASIEAHSEPRFALREGDLPISPFLAAVHQSFSLHLPLALKPDHIWTLLAHSFAIHINMASEEYRSRLVPHQGKESIIVCHDSLVKGCPLNPWPSVLRMFSDQIADRIGEATRAALVCDFSTTTPAERAASEIVLMDSLQSYYSFFAMTSCGIPEISLEGSKGDWERVREKIKLFRGFDLEDWVDDLDCLLARFVAAFDGSVDREFWCSFYKFHDVSGGPLVSGWINTFFPYIFVEGFPRANESARLANQRAGSGPSLMNFPGSLSSVPFVWDCHGVEYQMEMAGGFVGFSQDPDSFALHPEIGWIIREKGSLS